METIEVTDASLQKAVGERMNEFIQVFTDKCKEAIGGEPTTGIMSLLTGKQHPLLTYQISRDEVVLGGFCQLTQNGYGGYIFNNPSTKVMRLRGVENFLRLVYRAKKIYDAHHQDLKKEHTEDESIVMYERCEVFDDLEEEYLDTEEEVITLVTGYADDYLELFAKIVKREMQCFLSLHIYSL